MKELDELINKLNSMYPYKIGDILPKLILYFGGDGVIMVGGAKIFEFHNLQELSKFIEQYDEHNKGNI